MQELKQLRELAESVPGFCSDERVQSSGFSDRTGEIAAKIVDLETKINREISCYIDVKSEIREQIERVDSAELRLILQKRYLNLDKWEQIALDMNYCYQWVHKLHSRALLAIESDYYIAI